MKYKCLEKTEKKKSKVLKFFNKLLTAVLIGIISLIVMEYSPKFKSFMQEKVLKENFSFGVFDKLYNKNLGNILPKDNSNVVSVFDEKISFTSKEKYLDGYNLKVTNNYLVPVINEGVVVFIGDKENLGKIIIIEQSDGIVTTYGNIKTSNVNLYDHLIKGSFLGEVENDKLYISLEKDGEYLDIETYLS